MVSVKKEFVVKGMLQMHQLHSPSQRYPGYISIVKALKVLCRGSHLICFGLEFPKPFAKMTLSPFLKLIHFRKHILVVLYLINKGPYIAVLKTDHVILFCFSHRHV